MAWWTRSGLAGICVAIGALFPSATVSAQKVVVDATPSHVVNAFSPIRSLGAGVDRLRAGEGAPEMARSNITKEEVERNTDQLLSGPVLKSILGAGWQPVTYRQNTELQIEAWHWNPRGTWSDPEKEAGYFTGSAEPDGSIRHSWAYPLPNRGDTLGDGDGWSRLTDGDLKSYWKSNPYLTSSFTGEDDALHPQWILIDLGRKVEIDAIRIAWANPYAKDYAVQFWTGDLEPFYQGTTRGTWQTFPKRFCCGWQGRDHNDEAYRLENPRPVSPNLDDKIVRHLRHTRFGRQTQLRRLCNRRALCRNPL